MNAVKYLIRQYYHGKSDAKKKKKGKVLSNQLQRMAEKL
jgi:hypothetical protein